MKCFIYGGAELEFSIKKVPRFLVGRECIFALSDMP